MPEIDGTAAAPVGVATSSERHTPRPGITFVELAQLACTHAPLRRTEVELAHARQLLGPAPEQLEQVVSQAWHELEPVSKNWVFVHVGRQRPLVRTGSPGEHVEHWLNDGPEQVAQSGWQLTHWPPEVKVLEGQLETHLPDAANWPVGHVRQKSDDPTHEPHEDEHAAE